MEKIKKIQSRLSDLEEPLLQARNLAMAARMMSSADEMPKDAGAALDAVADMILTKLGEIMDEWKRILDLARSTEENLDPTAE
jgi:hypothetical protein